MAGYIHIYCIGNETYDGINPIFYQILVGTSDRMWLEPRYFDKRFSPLGKVKVIVPPGPDHPDILLDACIAFSPKFFESCLSLGKVAQVLSDAQRIDFHMKGEPVGWAELREESRPLFKEMTIFEAELKKNQGSSVW